MYLGTWRINDYLTFPANTHRVDTGAASDADSVPTYRIYEDETGTAITTGSMALLDYTNTTGFYSERIQLLAATGFEQGKCYTIYVEATVNSVTGTQSHTFQIESGTTTDLLKILKNRWRIDKDDKQLIFYDDDGTTALYTFDLKDYNGDASYRNIWERTPV